MGYSIRSRSAPHRLGDAGSADGLTWARKDDEAGLTRPASGWDSEMMAHPNVIDAGGRRDMFVDGNRHGERGFGRAVPAS